MAAIIGGAIAPGVNLSIEALHHGGGPAAAGSASGARRTVIGRSHGRGDAIGHLSGAISGWSRALVDPDHAEFGPAEARIVGTGGLAPLLAEGTEIFDRIDPELTLEGLRMLAGRNPGILQIEHATRTQTDRRRVMDRRERAAWPSCPWAGRARSA